MDVQQVLIEQVNDDIPSLSMSERLKISNQKKNIFLLKRGIWLYFLLLIFEGGLRKWILPALASPILIIRDPLAIWLLIVAWRSGIYTFNRYVVLMYIVSIIALFSAIFLGHGNFFVAVFGVRTLIVHFPVIFIIGKVFDRDDVLKMGKFIIWLILPMTVLLFLQFNSPQSAFVNRGVGGDVEGAGFSGALGFFRPPGTFSFTNGTALFYSLSACFVLFFWLGPKQDLNRVLLICASFAVLAAIPLSISRTLFFSILITLFFIVLAILKRRRSIVQIILITFVLSAGFLALVQLKSFQTATSAFTTRFSDASDSEGGIKGTVQKRIVGTLIGAITDNQKLPFFGYGIGMGTNVGSVLLTGKNQFLVAETEWGRLIGEMGIVMGLIVIIIRLTITAKIAIASYRQLSIGDFLPWILLSYCAITLPQSQWAQPTALGFCVFVAGLTIASLRIPQKQIIQNG